MNCHFPREGSRATNGRIERRFAKQGDDGNNLRVSKLISLKVEVGFSTQRVNEKSGRSSADEGAS